MACPIVIGAKANPALFVFLLVIPAKRLAARLSPAFVKAHPGEQPPGRLNPQHRRALALVGYNFHRIARALKRGAVGNIKNPVLRVPVMREPYLAPIGRVALRPKPIEVRRKWLALHLVMINPPDLQADELRSPENEVVRLRPRPPDVGEQPYNQVWVFWNKANPPLVLGGRQMLPEIGTLKGRQKFAFPDVAVKVRSLTLVLLPLPLKDCRKPRVIPKVHLDNLGPGIGRLVEPLIRGRSL